MILDLGMIFTDKGLIPCSHFKRKALPRRITQSKVGDDAYQKGLIQGSKEKGGHLKKMSFSQQMQSTHCILGALGYKDELDMAPDL